MKKNILLLFFIVTSFVGYAQKLTQENVLGKWMAKSITSPSGLYYNVEKDSLSVPKAILSSLKKKGNDSSAISTIKQQLGVIQDMLFVFNTDGTYSVINTMNTAKADTMEMGQYAINGSKGFIFRANPKHGKDSNEPKKIKAYFKNGYMVLHAPGEANTITIFELKKQEK